MRVLVASLLVGAAGFLGVVTGCGRSGSTAAQSALPGITFDFLARRGATELALAMAVLKRAAEDGDVAAQATLGRVYLQGLPSAARDPHRAAQWLARAAEAGHPDAAYALGTLHQSGEGLPRNMAAAIDWFQRAAAAGSVRAMFTLANVYRAGDGVPRDDARALALYGRAAEHEDAAALQVLAMAYLRGEMGLEPDEDEARRYSMEAEHAARHAGPH